MCWHGRIESFGEKSVVKGKAIEKGLWICDFGQEQMRTVENNSYRFAWRASRRRNCLTETTRTRFRRASLIKSRSRLRSSSLVTKYCAFPEIAASTIWSSSGSRHICSSPDVCTTVARAAINRTNACASRREYRNRRTSRGLLRTSAISLSCESDVTTLNSSSPRRQQLVQEVHSA
jgi:hypothetical protein